MQIPPGCRRCLRAAAPGHAAPDDGPLPQDRPVAGRQRCDASCEGARKRMCGRINHLIDPAETPRRLDRSRSQSPRPAQEAIERSREEVPRRHEAGGCRARKSRNRTGRRRIETWQRWPTPRPTEPPAKHAAPPHCPCNETWEYLIRWPQHVRRSKTRHGNLSVPCRSFPCDQAVGGPRADHAPSIGRAVPVVEARAALPADGNAFGTVRAARAGARRFPCVRGRQKRH